MAIENNAITIGNPSWVRGGPSPNPGGRPKGLAALVRAETQEGEELVRFMLGVLRGRRKAPLRLRMEAAAWLADRGWGKAPQPLEHAGPDGGPMHFTLDLSARAGAAEVEP